MTPILIVPPRPYPEQTPVHEVWRRRGWHVHRVSSLREPLNVLRERARIYGDYEFCIRVALALQLELVSPAEELLLTVEPEWLRRDVSRVQLDELRAHLFPLFVKPLAHKLFPAMVYASWKSLRKQTESLLTTTQVLVSERVTFDNEVRCLVLDRKVLSCSVYEGVGALEDAGQFAQAFAESHDVALTYVLDVGFIHERGWAVIEVNPLWGGWSQWLRFGGDGGLRGCGDPRLLTYALSPLSRYAR